MIITCRNRVSFLWIVLATLPWVAVIFKDKVMGIAFTFSMRKFVENPAALTFLLTLPWYISWIIPPVVNFVADRIWTRWGRRKPFIITSWIGTMTSIALMPLAPDFGWLLAAYMVFCVFNDLGGPVESLKMEIVPPAQRAKSAAVLSWIAQVAVLVFWVVAIGRFDEMTTMFGLPVSGEQGLYWTVSIGMIVMLLFLSLGIKETNPHSALLHERFSLRNVFGGLFSKHLWPVYILAFSVAVLGSSLGAFNQLLITEQWAYTKQDQGTNIAVGGIINLFLIPLLGIFADKVGRGKVYVGLVIAGIVVNFTMYLYYNFVLFDARPTLVEMIVFGEMLSVIGILTGMALTPFVYDFIPRNELGTYAAGSGLVTKATHIVTANLMGLFVWGYASMFLGPPGEMVRVTLRDEAPKAQVQSILDSAKWTDPGREAVLDGPKLTARPWYATGAALDHGRGYEIRLRNADSTVLRDQRDRLETERGKYRARRGYALTRLREATGQAPVMAAPKFPAPDPVAALATIGDVRAYATGLMEKAASAAKAGRASGETGDKVARLAATAEAELAGESVLGEGIAAIDAVLEHRAAMFRKQVETALGPKLLADGEQVLAASSQPAIVASFPLTARPVGSAVEKTLDRLRMAEPTVVDMRVVPVGEGLTLDISAAANSDDAPAVAARLRSALTSVAVEKLQTAMAWPPVEPTVKPATAIRMDLRILEDPLDRHPSPITRVIDSITSVVVETATPERRLNAFGRNLRRAGLVEHAGASLVPGDNNAVRLTAVVLPASNGIEYETPPAPVAARLASLLDPRDVPAAGELYQLALPVAKEQRMTIARPVISASFAKQQYDYLAGYVAVFFLQLIGLGITFTFLWMVRTGLVRRRGAEEAEAVA